MKYPLWRNERNRTKVKNEIPQAEHSGSGRRSTPRQKSERSEVTRLENCDSSLSRPGAPPCTCENHLKDRMPRARKKAVVTSRNTNEKQQNTQANASPIQRAPGAETQPSHQNNISSRGCFGHLLHLVCSSAFADSPATSSSGGGALYLCLPAGHERTVSRLERAVKGHVVKVCTRRYNTIQIGELETALLYIGRSPLVPLISILIGVRHCTTGLLPGRAAARRRRSLPPAARPQTVERPPFACTPASPPPYPAPAAPPVAPF